MIKLVGAVCMALLSGCAFKQDVPVANLEYKKIERYKQTVLYDLHYSADRNLMGPYKSLIGVKMTCALSDDTNFKTEHRMHYFADGAVSRNKSGGPFDFISQMMFSESILNGNSERNLPPEDIRALLAGKDYIPCRFSASATLIETYFSNEMRIPVADIFRAISE